MYMGSGGAPEGVLAAAALKCMGGQMMGRLIFRNEDEKARARKHGIEDLDRVYTRDDMVTQHVIFAATGVTDGSVVRGARRDGGLPGDRDGADALQDRIGAAHALPAAQPVGPTLARPRNQRVAIAFMAVWLIVWMGGMLVVIYGLASAALGGEFGASLMMLAWLAVAGLGLYLGARRLKQLVTSVDAPAGRRAATTTGTTTWRRRSRPRRTSRPPRRRPGPGTGAPTRFRPCADGRGRSRPFRAGLFLDRLKVVDQFEHLTPDRLLGTARADLAGKLGLIPRPKIGIGSPWARTPVRPSTIITMSTTGKTPPLAAAMPVSPGTGSRNIVAIGPFPSAFSP